MYQCGYLIPRDYKHAMELDKLNGNSRWYDATKMGMDQINEYQEFKDDRTAKHDPKSKQVTNASHGHQKVMVHPVIACKHDGCYKACLVAGDHLTSDPIDSIYSGVVSTRSLSVSLLSQAEQQRKSGEQILGMQT